MVKVNQTIGRLLLFLLFISIVITGCSSKTSETVRHSNNQPPNQDRSEKKLSQQDFSGVVLDVAFGLGESEWKVFNDKILPAFKLQTGITVRPLKNRSDSLISQLTAEVESGNPAIDMFTMDVNNLSNLVQNDMVVDLTKYKSIIPQTVVKGMVDASTFDNQLLFLPFRPNVEITFYNEKMFNKYGIEPPRNWDELLQVAKTLHARSGEGRIAIKANLKTDNVLHLFDFIRQAGGDPYVLNDEGSIQAFTFLQKLYPYLSKKSVSADWSTMNQYLAEDSVYLGTNWPFYIPQFHEQGKDEMKAYEGWEGPDRASHVLGGDVIGIPKGSENIEAAIVFAEYLLSKPVQEVLAKELAWPAVRYDSYGIIEGYQKPYFETIKKILAEAEPRGNKPYWSEAEPIYIEAFKKAVVEGENVERVLNDAAMQLKQLKSQYN